jgi:hypothetical protein
VAYREPCKKKELLELLYSFKDWWKTGNMRRWNDYDGLDGDNRDMELAFGNTE